MSQHRLLIELGCEELPHSQVASCCEKLGEALLAEFKKQGIEPVSSNSYFTPRRLAFVFSNVPEVIEGRAEQRFGPNRSAAVDADGNPTGAGLGFARACGVEFSALSWAESPKGERLAYEVKGEDRALDVVLSVVLPAALASLQGFKMMRWGAGKLSFLRPVHWLCVLHGEKTLDVEWLGCESDRLTYGHRIHHPDAISLTSADAYEDSLMEAFVVVDPAQRRQRLEEQLDTYDDGQVVVRRTEGLLDEVIACVEWPITHMGTFDERFLVLPESLLSTVLHHHQKCFHCVDGAGQVLNRFVLVSNIVSDEPGAVIHGNERVVRARLSDALFFFDQDKSTGLEAYYQRLGAVDWMAGLGTLADKVNRLERWIGTLAQMLGCDVEEAKLAARYAKADLVSQTVQELPEMAGEWGALLAEDAGLPSNVASALQEQIFPQHAGDRLPATKLGLCLAITDRLDTLCGGFLAGAMPTADKDPFALRRHTFALIRLVIATETDVDIRRLLGDATEAYGRIGDLQDMSCDFWNFVADRLDSYWLDQGVPAHVVKAMHTFDYSDFWQTKLRLQALAAFLADSASEPIVAAGKRVWQMVKKYEDERFTLDTALFEVDAERNLHRVAVRCDEEVEAAIKRRDYTGALNALAPLGPVVTSFFDEVMVLCEDTAVRTNRLALLKDVFASFNKVANLVVAAGL